MKTETKQTRQGNNDHLRRLTNDEYTESYLKHCNPNMRRLSDEEYAELYKEAVRKCGADKIENS